MSRSPTTEEAGSIALTAVIVDIGGVLEHTPPTGWVQRWEARLGLEPGGLRERVSTVWQPGRTGHASLAEMEARTAQALGLDERASDALWGDVWAEYVGTLNSELLDYLAGLRPRYTTAILSNSFVGAREREQSLYGFAEVFDAVLYSHEEGLEKPDPAFYELACERLGVSPAEAVFVDDLVENVEGARAVGMTGVLFTSTEQTIRGLRQLLEP